MGKNRSKRKRIAAKARTNLEGKEKLSSEDLRHQITLSQSRRETQDKSGERSFHSKAPKSSHPKNSQAAAEKFDTNSPIVRKLIGWLNKEGEARSQGTGRETGQGEDEEVESQGRISVHKRMRKNASQRLGPRTEESGENSGGHDNEDAGDILKLRKEMEELKRQVDKDGSFGPTVEIISPFTARVMKAQLPRGMKAPEIRYKGVTDPNVHLAAYQTHMLMHAMEDEIQCRLFVGTLEGPVVKWFLTLPNGTIDCFKDLAQLFLNAYGGRFQPKKHFTHLFSLKQKEGETNSELVQRWNEAINEVEPMDDKTSIALFMNVLRTTPRRATGETPFALAYGFEAKVPTEVLVPSTRVEAYTPSLNEQLMEVDSHFIQERRDDAAVKAEEYQRQSKRYHDKKTVLRTFEVGDWVLRKREKSQPTKGGKLAQNWEGPYRVEKVVRTGTYQLATSEGKALDNYWNVEHLKKFYQ
ncbi:unnamed protein product [Cuscuta campestris]|uniref:Retrotransposon gag domain-containing protein n=1 Tax=Cuscuta campestris TaxID=132261 RepID=A0A484MBD4_9ASTE|nr:unnamed protein product [Cuscuta campestris]